MFDITLGQSFWIVKLLGVNLGEIIQEDTYLKEAHCVLLIIIKRHICPKLSSIGLEE